MSRQTPPRWLKTAGVLLLVLLFAYLVVYPSWQVYGRASQPQAQIQALEEMSLSELILLRAMEACAAIWMFALGASIGSFLNVVVYRLPRGRSLMWERSQCPSCQYFIAGKDNLPILGWLMLNGSCRNCGSPISARYPLIETVTACLFLLFYFVELLSGGGNLPVRSPNTYAGVVWIVFYTKWDLVRLFLYHCFLLSTLLAWAMIAFDGQKVPWRSWLTAWLMAILAACLWPDLQLLRESWAFLIPTASAWLQGGGTSLLGALLGGLLAGAFAGLSRVLKTSSVDESRELIGPLALTGAVLGPQGVLSAAGLMFVVHFLRAVSCCMFGCCTKWPLSGDLLVAVIGQHLVWRWLIETGVPWWPGPNSGPAHLLSVTACVLLLASLPRKARPQPPSAPLILVPLETSSRKAVPPPETRPEISDT